jgi:hypothetical protein
VSLRLSRLSGSSTVRHGIVDSNGYPTRTTPSSDSEDSTVYARTYAVSRLSSRAMLSPPRERIIMRESVGDLCARGGTKEKGRVSSNRNLCWRTHHNHLHIPHRMNRTGEYEESPSSSSPSLLFDFLVQWYNSKIRSRNSLRIFLRNEVKERKKLSSNK